MSPAQTLLIALRSPLAKQAGGGWSSRPWRLLRSYLEKRAAYSVADMFADSKTVLNDHPEEWRKMRRKVRRLVKRDQLPGDVKKYRDTNTGTGPTYNPVKGEYNLPTLRCEVIAHELGHGMNTKSLQSVAGGWGGRMLHAGAILMPIAGGLAGLWANAALPRDSQLRNWLWTGPLLSSLPLLADEAAASIRGYRRYKDDLPMDDDSKQVLGQAFGTYLKSYLAPALLGSAAMGGLRLYDLYGGKNK
jgi:hypothetical protein